VSKITLRHVTPLHAAIFIACIGWHSGMKWHDVMERAFQHLTVSIMVVISFCAERHRLRKTVNKQLGTQVIK